MGRINYIIEKQKFPSHKFGNITGMDWIYSEYKLPDEENYLADTLLKWRDCSDYQKMYALYKKLITMNPELERLRKTRKGTIIFDICYGVISRFNIDDIEFFSFNRKHMSSYNQIKRPLTKIISAKAKCDIEWVMSPKTLSRVCNELKIQHERN